MMKQLSTAQENGKMQVGTLLPRYIVAYDDMNKGRFYNHSVIDALISKNYL